jgi:predicted component of type VI protein secretion system
MPAQLVSLTEGPSILLDKPILLLGRHPECDIQIDSRKVSRRHCCIAQVEDYLIVRDLASTNGIRINGVRVVEGRLKAGDEVTIGGYRYQVRWDSVPGLPATGAVGKEPKVEPADPARATCEEEDNLLEASDEPVALAEPNGEVISSVRGLAATPRPGDRRPPEPGPDDSVPLPADEQLPSHIIPDELDLAPASDLKLGSKRPAS